MGDSWRKRWDSLRLFSPAFYDGLPGLRFPAGPGVKPTKDQMGNYLEGYASHFKLPVRSGVRVTRLSRQGDHFLVETGEKRFEAEQVVIATGNYCRPRIPRFAPDLDLGIVQFHSEPVPEPVTARSRRSLDSWRRQFGSGDRDGNGEEASHVPRRQRTGDRAVPGGQFRRALPLRSPDPRTRPQHPQRGHADREEGETQNAAPRDAAGASQAEGSHRCGRREGTTSHRSRARSAQARGWTALCKSRT